MRFARMFDAVFRRVHVLSPREAYRLWAPTYDDRQTNAVLFLEERAVLPLLDEISMRGKAVIDFGCGTGRHITHLLERGAAKIVGVDFSPEMLSVAGSKLQDTRCSFVQSPLERLPFHDSLFDVGIASLVLSHIAALKTALSEMTRVLRNGAHLLIADLHWTFEKRGWHRTFKPSDSRTSRLAVQNITHLPAEYQRVFQRLGLIVDQTVEPTINDSVRSLFEQSNMMGVYERYQGEPLLVVYQLRKVAS